MSNRGTGGRSVGNPHCRNLACNENKIIETLPHIRGSCPKTELLRNNAHHKVRTTLANLFRAKNLVVHEEVHCAALCSTQRRSNSKQKGWYHSGRPKERTRPHLRPHDSVGDQRCTARRQRARREEKYIPAVRTQSEPPLRSRRVGSIWALVRRTRNRIETLAGLLQEPRSAEKRSHKNMSVRIARHIAYN